MARYLLVRVAGLLGVLFVVSIITFCLMHLIPGGPYDAEKMPLSEEAKANILRSYGLDKPLWQQYVLYIGNALRFEFGYSYQSPGETVTQLIARRLRELNVYCEIHPFNRVDDAFLTSFAPRAAASRTPSSRRRRLDSGSSETCN